MLIIIHDSIAVKDGDVTHIHIGVLVNYHKAPSSGKSDLEVMTFFNANIRTEIVARTMRTHIVGHLRITHIQEITAIPFIILVVRIHNIRIGSRDRRVIRFTLMFELDLVFIQGMGLPAFHH